MRVGETETPETRDEEAVSPKAKLAPLPVAATRWEFWLLALVCLVSLCTTLHFAWNHLLPPATATDGQGAVAAASTCRQCKAEWWQDFWQWRLKELQGQPSDPPPGMQWEWGSSVNNTDWYESSAEFVDELVRPYARPWARSRPSPGLWRCACPRAAAAGRLCRIHAHRRRVPGDRGHEKSVSGQRLARRHVRSRSREGQAPLKPEASPRTTASAIISRVADPTDMPRLECPSVIAEAQSPSHFEPKSLRLGLSIAGLPEERAAG